VYSSHHSGGGLRGFTKRDGCAMTSRTKSNLGSRAAGSKGVPHDESARTTATTSHRQIPCRRPYRGHLPGIGLLEKLALHMAGSLPGNGSFLERSAEQKAQNHPDQNAPTHRPGRRGVAPQAGSAWPRLWGCFYPAGARTARDRACAFTAHDLSDSPPLCQGGDLNPSPSYIRPAARKISPGIDSTPWSREDGKMRRCVMERTARLLLTRAVALRKANHLALRREHTLHIRFLDVRFTW
jgi:hypothetical protein